MGNTVYLETSIVSYLVSRPSRDLVTAGHQQLTHEWWANERHAFKLYASALVLREASAGDPEAAAARRLWLSNIELLTITPDAEQLSEALIRQAALPQKAAADALHIATASIIYLPGIAPILPMPSNARILSEYVANSALNPPYFAHLKNLLKETTMWIDPIVELTRKLRDEYAAQHGYNVHAIIEDLKQWEKDGFPTLLVTNEPISTETTNAHAQTN